MRSLGGADYMRGFSKILSALKNAWPAGYISVTADVLFLESCLGFILGQNKG